MKAQILDKICSWCVALFDWWMPSPEQCRDQMQELREAKAEFRQAVIEAFGTDRFAAWVATWMDRIGGR